jgi:hypothetical protein
MGTETFARKEQLVTEAKIQTERVSSVLGKKWKSLSLSAG